MEKEEYHSAVKKCQENANRLKAKAALERVKYKDTCLIKEIKKLSGPLIKASVQMWLMDAVERMKEWGSFKEVYMKMYYRNETEDAVLKFTAKIERLTTHKDADLVN